MIIQIKVGALHAVSNIVRYSSNITWIAPFSLNLTNTQPDIIYCVEVYNITCGERHFLSSDCDVTEPRYISDRFHPQYTYGIVVTPRSNTNGALSGVSLQKEGILNV